MKVLVVAPNVSEKGLAASFRINLILEAFLKNGDKVWLYTSTNDINSRLRHFEGLKIRIVTNLRNRIGIKILTKIFGVPDPMLFWGLKVFNEIKKNMDNEVKFDFAFFSSPPHSLHLIGLLVKRSYGLPFFTDFRDDWMGSHRMSYPTFLHRKFSGILEKRVIEQAKAVFCAIPIVSDDLKKKYPDFEKKIHTATNGFDDLFKQKLKDKDFGHREEKKTIVYCGGDYNGFVTNKINNFAEDLRNSDLSNRWKILTAGPGINVKGLNNQVWEHFGLIDPSRVEELMADATVHLSVLPDGDLVNSRTIPLKMYSQVLTKGAIVFIGNKGATNVVFNGEPGVFFLEPGDWNSLCSYFATNESILSKKYERNIDNFSFGSIVSDMIGIIKGYLR